MCRKRFGEEGLFISIIFQIFSADTTTYFNYIGGGLRALQAESEKDGQPGNHVPQEGFEIEEG